MNRRQFLALTAAIGFSARSAFSASALFTPVSKSGVMDIFISDGQSWRSHADPVNLQNLGITSKGVPNRAATFTGGVDALPPIGMDWVGRSINGLIGLSWDMTANGGSTNAAGCIGWSSAQTYAALSSVINKEANPVLDYSHAFPGQPFPSLAEDGEVPDKNRPWLTGLAMNAKALRLSKQAGFKPRFLGVGITHGSESGRPYIEDLEAWIAAYDYLALNGPEGQQLHYYIDVFAPESDKDTMPQLGFDQITFAKKNERVHLIGPRYPYAFKDTVHHTGDAYMQIGELEGLAKHTVHNLNQPWEPLSVLSVTLSHGKLKVDFNLPQNISEITIDTETIKPADQLGFKIKREDGLEIPISNILVHKTGITGTIPKIDVGQKLTFGYACWGKATLPGTHSSCWGNIKAIGPSSPWRMGKTIDFWLCPDKRELITI